MIAGDIERAGFQKAATGALALCGAMVTDAQADILGALFEGQSRASIAALLRSQQLPERRRITAIIQAFVSGKTREFGFRGGEIMVLAAEVVALANSDQAWGRRIMQGDAMRALSQVGETLGIGSAAWYRGEMGTARTVPTLNAEWLHRHMQRWDPEAFMLACGVTPEDIGSGYIGMEEVKGNLSPHVFHAPAAPGGVLTSGNAPEPSAAQKVLQDMGVEYEGSK